LLDTSVVIDLDRIERGQLPGELPISAVTLAELAAGPLEVEAVDLPA
jgi:predicted nucleic acid-binding protein